LIPSLSIPDDLIAVSIDDEGTICRTCIEKTPEVLDDEQKATPIFRGDGWYPGETCVRCGMAAR